MLCAACVQIGGQARLMSAALRKLANHASKCGCTVMFINQLRYKVGACMCIVGLIRRGNSGPVSLQPVAT